MESLMTKPQYYEHLPRKRHKPTARRLKNISDDLRALVEGEIKALLHAHRDTRRNCGEDTVRTSFRVNEGYYGEAFGIMRALYIQGYGYFGSSNLPATREDDWRNKVSNVTDDIQNLKWWMSQLETDVLREEGFKSDHKCSYCLERYNKDDAALIEKGKLKVD
jgi:hypothetical protein